MKMRSPSRNSSTKHHHKKSSKRRRSDSSDSGSSGNARRRDKSRNDRRQKRERSRSNSSSERSNRKRKDEKRSVSNSQGRIKKERSRSVSPRVEESRQRLRNDERSRSNHGNRGGRGFDKNRGFRGRRKPNEEEGFEWGRKEDREEKPEVKVEKEQPNFGLSGKLTEATNMVNGVVVKYSEPPEARKSTKRWRFYVFKGEETLPTLYVHRQSAYLIGKDRRVADIRLDHPSISAQHAALQYRLVSSKSEDGLRSFKAIRPYIIDLESSNGTFLNNKKIEPKRYVELKEKDVLKFGFSSREYVVLHEHSQDNESGEEIVDEGPNA